MSSENIEVKLKFVVDGSGARVIDQMTGATREASKAEEEYQKKLAARQKFVETLRKEREETERSTLTQGRLSTMMERHGQTPSPDRLHAFASESWHERMRQAMQTPGAPLPPPPPPPSGPTTGGTSDTAATLGSLTSKANIAAAVAGWAAKSTVNVNRELGTPYADPHQRFENAIRSVPLLGQSFGLGADFGRVLTGATRKFQQVEADMTTDRIEAAGRTKLARVESGPQLHETAMRERAKLYAGFQLPRSANHDRGTVLGAKLAAEEGRMLPIQEELRKATQERIAQQNRATLYTERASDLERQAVELERRRIAAMERRKSLTDRSVTNKVDEQGAADALRQERLLTQMSRDKSQLAAEARQAASGAMQESAASKQRERGLQIAAAKEQYSTSLSREQTARSQAQRLGSLSPIEYQMAIHSYRQVQQIGLVNSTPDMIARAKLIGGETIARMEEAQGKRRVQEMRKLGLGDEYRDTVDESAKRTRQARENLSRADEANVRRTAQEQAEAVRGVPDAMKEAAGEVRSVAEAMRTHFVREIEQLRHDVASDAWWANQQK